MSKISVPVDAAAAGESRRGAGAARFAQGRSAVAWREQHLYSLFSSLGHLSRRARATALTVAVMALALLLPLLLQVGLRNLEGFGDGLRDAREISVFLAPTRDAQAAEAMRTRFAAMPGVARVHLRTPDAALVELETLESFAGASALLERNPLPFVLLVEAEAPLDGEALRALAKSFEQIEHVDFVQFELAWRDRLDRALALAQRLVWIAAVLFALAALLVVGNTIRLDVAARSHEIAVVQLLGGSDAFVRRPFLYAGLWYGGAAAVLALIAAAVVLQLAQAPAAAFAAGFAQDFELLGLSLAEAATALAAGTMLGWLGAWVACSSWLAHGRPR